MRKYNRTKEELDKIIEFVEEDFPRHHRKLEEITVNTVLTPREAIDLAKRYHQEHGLDGTVDERTESLLFDEAYTFRINPDDRENDDIRPAWRVTVDLEPNPFLFEDYTLIVSDPDKTVMGMLDANGHPVSDGNEITDEDIEYITSGEEAEKDKA
ncbi:hypothetical protein ACFSVM_00750 [Paenibacillus shunpengii]|uniref:Uncharacterized protein n=2 Tax=Paenibacillus TaxID=44249 RepID=A0ABW5SIN6_9BACL|nr:hypothetical protein [Paenibacillus sp. FSL H7-0326]OMC72289.1 hypothetical protein BK126_09935 [Paenibacillus sp. FSL H7-0326]